MTRHVITKDYFNLKGFTTDSIFKRPAFYADTDVNMQRLPDGTFAPRRGYQAQTANIGGLGYTKFNNLLDLEVQDVCINVDGNLYKKKTGTLTIDFSAASNSSYVTYEIYVDPTLTSDNQTSNFPPYSIVNDLALVTDSINFRFSKVTYHSGVSIGTGNNSYTGTLPGAPIAVGSIVMTDGTLTIHDNANGDFIGDVGIGANGIDYTTGNFTVTFSGITGAVTAVYNSTLQSQFDQEMGKGYDTPTPYLISSLITELNGISGVTASATGDTSNPGAFLEVCQETIIANGKSATLNFYYWVEVNKTVDVVFPGLLASLNTMSFVNASFAAYENELYIANKDDPVKKFDGQTVYNAGMPNGVSVESLTNLGGGNVNAGAHSYTITYEQIDATGRLVEGVMSDPVSITLGGASEVQVEVNNIEEDSGYNTGCAIIDGVQTITNTIQVLSGHTLLEGDKAFFLDDAGAEHTLTITGVTPTSLEVFNSLPINITDATDWQKVISNNLKINIYRTAAGGEEPNFLISIPNNSFSATTNYDDDTADADLGAEYITPVRPPDPPPQVGVVFPYKNQLIFTADPNTDDIVWFSDPNGPEYVSQSPSEPNSFLVPANTDDVVGGGVAGSTLVIFKQTSIYAVSGDLSSFQFNVNPVSQGSNIGCVAHSTIQSVGSLLYFLHTNGVYSMSETSIVPTDQWGSPIALSIPIDSVFRKIPPEYEQQFRLERAVAINYTKDNQYLLFLPCESQTGPRFANDNSQVLCFDYLGKNWFVWTRVNAAGGFSVWQDNLYWQDRRTTSNPVGVISNTYKQHRTYLLIDQVDHVTPIRVTWISSWEDLGQPRVRKKFVRAALLFDNVSSRFQTNVPLLYFFTSLDWNKGVVDTEAIVTTEVESTLWSTDAWSWTEWSGYQDTFFVVPLRAGSVSKSIQIGLQLNQLNTSFNLQGFQLEIAPDFRSTIVR